MKLGKSIPALILLLSLLASVAAWAKGDGHGGGRHGGKFGGGHFGGRQFEGARHFGGGGHVRVHPSFLRCFGFFLGFGNIPCENRKLFF